MARITSRRLKAWLPTIVNLADLHLRTFVNLENDFERRRRYLADLGLHRGELTPALRQIFLDHHGGVLHLIRIVLRLDRQTDLAFLEPVQDFRNRERLVAFVIDRAHHAALHHDEAQDHAAIGARFGLQANIVEAAAIPQRHEVAMHIVFVVDIALFSADQGAHGILRNAPGAAEFDRFDHLSAGGYLGLFGGFRRL